MHHERLTLFSSFPGYYYAYRLHSLEHHLRMSAQIPVQDLQTLVVIFALQTATILVWVGNGEKEF